MSLNLRMPRSWVAKPTLTDREFLPAALDLIETPPSPIGMALMSSICLFILIACVVSELVHIDIFAVAPGRIQPSGRSKVVQPFGMGRVKAILVQNGSPVRQGDLLVDLESEEANADLQALMAQQQSLEAEIARRRALLAFQGQGPHAKMSTPEIFAAIQDPAIRDREGAVLLSDYRKFATDLEAVDAKIGENTAQRKSLQMIAAADEKLLLSLNERVQMRENLAAQDLESRANVLDAIEDLKREESASVEKNGKLFQVEAENKSLEREKENIVAKFVNENTQGIAAAEAKLDQAVQAIIKAKSALGHTRLTSPVDGVVQGLTATTVGQIVTSGQQLMTIVPDKAPLEVEAKVANEDIGFVKVGQEVVLKIEAFPFTRYGTVAGHVVSVSRDSMDAGEALPTAEMAASVVNPSSSAAAPTAKTRNLVYPVTIEIEDTAVHADGRSVELSPGMSVAAEIKTGKRKIADFLFSPLAKVASEAMHEH